MDPLSAAGLAGCIIQFVDFGSKIVSKAIEIHHQSTPGVPASYHELGKVTSDLSALLRRLHDSLQTKSIHQTLTDDDRADIELGGECQRVAEEMLSALKKLGKTGKHGIRSSLYQALRTVLHKEQIDALEHRLDRLRQQLIIRLLSSLHQYAQSSGNQQQNLLRHMESFASSVSQQISSSIAWQLETMKEMHGIRDAYGKVHMNGTASETAAGWTHQALLDAVLKGLKYPDLGAREMQIDEATSSTFDWIYQDPRPLGKPWSNFVEWLERGHGVYWITGKAGAGKSTLMKFLRQNGRTAELLNASVGATPVIIAGFFFWNSGTEMQMSYLGLLRSLLHEIFNKQPSMVPELAPERCALLKALGADVEDWTTEECLLVLRRLTDERFAGRRFCFFVDGLDEFHGTHDQVINLLKDLAKSPNIMICAASRPWVVFQDAFAMTPSLMLQDLTHDDIETYVKAKFYGNSGYLRLEKYDAVVAARLCGEVADKAAGVFLWVRLVVQSLLDGIQQGDRLSDLHRRLDAIPQDLYEFFWKILRGIDENSSNHLQHASQLFQLQRFREPATLSLWTLALADDDDPSLWEGPPREPSEEQCAWILESMKRRLNSRTGGLLEVLGDSGRAGTQTGVGMQKSSKVQYLHRTVKDFVESRAVWTELTKAPFDPHVSFCKAYALHSKFFETAAGNARDRRLHMAQAIKHAQQASMTSNQSLLMILERLGAVVDHFLGRFEHREYVALKEDLNRIMIARSVKRGWRSRSPALIRERHQRQSGRFQQQPGRVQKPTSRSFTTSCTPVPHRYCNPPGWRYASDQGAGRHPNCLDY